MTHQIADIRDTLFLLGRPTFEENHVSLLKYLLAQQKETKSRRKYSITFVAYEKY